eukprot:GGOE01028677.1.p1 GENE.GGOE01028677.1~~GGOE01028677.1.p1  ORF type:complete len:292 (+),score=75.91 GGOE01028677.1:39-878(+)
MSEERQAKTLYQLVIEKVEDAKAKVEELREKLKDFDATSAGREKASAYFGKALDKTQEAIAELTKQAQTLKDNATEIPVRAFSNAFAKANEALSDIKERARSFDEQHQLSSKVSDIINHPRDQAMVAIASASTYVAEAAHGAYAQLQGVSDGIKCRVMLAAEQGLDSVMPLAVTYDEKLHISERATQASSVVAQQVTAFNGKYHVSDKLTDLDKRWAVSESVTSALTSLDQRITGGKVEPAMMSAYEMGLQMAGYLRGKFEESRQKVGDGPTAEAKTAE